MGRMKFLQWAAAQGWKHGQRYLQKAYNHFYDKGKLPDPKAILQKAKNYYDDFTGFTPTVVKPKPIKVPEQTKNILGIKSTLKGRPVEAVTPKTGIANIGDRIIKQMQKEGTTVKFDDLLRIYGKKPHVSAGKKLYLKKTGLDQGKVIDLIKKPPGKAEGGIAGMLGERTGYKDGDDVFIGPKRKKKTKKELEEEKKLREKIEAYIESQEIILPEDLLKKYQPTDYSLYGGFMDNIKGEQTGNIINDFNNSIINPKDARVGISRFNPKTDSSFVAGVGPSGFNVGFKKKFAGGGRTGSGLNYLLGEDDQNMRVPYAEGSSWEQFQKEKLMQKWQEYQQYLKNKEKEERQKPYLEERLGLGSGPVLEAAEGGRIGLKDGSWKPPSSGENILESTWKNMGSWEKLMWGLSLGGFEKGGRVGLAKGDTPSQAWMRDNFYKSGLDDKGVITLDDYINGGQGWRDYMDHGPGKAEGGRIGFKEGEGIMSRVGNMVDIRNVPYYGGKALQGLVNSAETLSKFPLAAGKLTSDLIQKPGFKRVPREKSEDEMTELFLQQTGQDYKLKPTEVWGEALENIIPGSWSENTGLTSLIEGMGEERSPEAQTVGGILGLGTEVAVPTGGAFKAGQFLLSKASKAMGKVKDGKTLNKLVEDKISDSGQSRRDFNIMAATSGLMVALKSLGLGGLLKTTAKLKPSDDVVMTLKTVIDDSDEMTDAGLAATGKWDGGFNIEGLSTAAKKTLQKIMKKLKKDKSGPNDLEIPKLRNPLYRPESDLYEEVAIHEGTYILDALKKAGHKVKFEHMDDMGGSGVDDVLNRFKNDDMYKGTKEGTENYKNFKAKTDKWSARKKAEYHTSITDDWGQHYNPDVEEFFDDFYGVVKKGHASGGRVPSSGGVAGMLGE